MAGREKSKATNISIKLIAIFYMMIAFVLAGMFLYTYVFVSLSLWQRVFGIILGLLLGYSIFFIGRNIWKGQAWARLIVLFISAVIILVSIGAYIFGRVQTVGAAVYTIMLLVVHGLIITGLLSRGAHRYFKQKNDMINIIRKQIQAIYEKNIEKHSPSDNQET